MLTLELLCLAIVGIHITVAATRAPSAIIFVRRVAIIAAASWIAEDTCLHLYSFYAYHPDWVPYVDRMPLMVCLIWPGVVLSSLELSQRLLGPRHRDPDRSSPALTPPGGVTRLLRATGMRLPRSYPANAIARRSNGRDPSDGTHGPLRQRLVPLVGALMVLADASFMEPLAVKAGLWRWFEPGFFGVPPIGVLGWAYFSGAAIAVFCANERRGRSGWADLWVLAAAPAAAHLLLLATWWGALRWVNIPLPSWGVAAMAWGVGLALALLAVARRANQLVPLGAMATRIPAALFFFGLLAIHGRQDPALICFALAFAPPYLALTRWSDLKC